MSTFENQSWKNILCSKPLLLSLVVSAVLLILWAIMAPVFFQYIQQRNGYTLNDPVLRVIPAHDVSEFIFLHLYLLISMSLILLIAQPFYFVIALQGYMILTFFRVLSVMLVPLEDPYGLIPLTDPLVDRLFYQRVITKDLFFSGHTSIVFLLAFCVPGKGYKALMILGGSTVGILLLVQHAHYFIDVAVAPLVAYAAYRASKKILIPGPEALGQN